MNSLIPVASPLPAALAIEPPAGDAQADNEFSSVLSALTRNSDTFSAATDNPARTIIEAGPQQHPQSLLAVQQSVVITVAAEPARPTGKDLPTGKAAFAAMRAQIGPEGPGPVDPKAQSRDPRLPNPEGELPESPTTDATATIPDVLTRFVQFPGDTITPQAAPLSLGSISPRPASDKVGTEPQDPPSPDTRASQARRPFGPKGATPLQPASAQPPANQAPAPSVKTAVAVSEILPVAAAISPRQFQAIGEMADCHKARTVSEISALPYTAPAPFLTTPAAHQAATDAPQIRPLDFTALVDRLVAAREIGPSHDLSFAVKHIEFGPVALRFHRDEGGLAVSFTNPDPDFARAVSQALPPVQPTSSADPAGQFQPGQQSAAFDRGSGSQGEAAAQRGQSQAQHRDERPGPRDTAPQSSHHPLAGQSRRRGIFA